MRALVIVLALAACQSTKPADDKSVPADRSTVLQGEALDSFCREQERQPGWTCDDHEKCETVNDGTLVTCRAKQH